MHNRSAKLISTAALSFALATSPFASAMAASSTMTNKSTAATSSQKSDVLKQVSEARTVVKQMRNDTSLSKLMDKAKGIFIVPDFGRAAAVVGVRGGSGMLLAKENGGWSNPAFYNMGGISVGAEIGASGGSIAFLLMTDNAVNKFMNKNSFSLNAGAGLSIIDYSANSQASWGKGDIIMWSDTKGAFAGVQISATDIMWDGEANKAYYGQKMTPSDVLNNAKADGTNLTIDSALSS